MTAFSMKNNLAKFVDKVDALIIISSCLFALFLIKCQKIHIFREFSNSRQNFSLQYHLLIGLVLFHHFIVLAVDNHSSLPLFSIIGYWSYIASSIKNWSLLCFKRFFNLHSLVAVLKWVKTFFFSGKCPENFWKLPDHRFTGLKTNEIEKLAFFM